MDTEQLKAYLDEVVNEMTDTTVLAEDDAEARIEIKGQPFLELNRRQCQALFSTPASVRDFFQAMGKPKDAALFFKNMILDQEVEDALDRCFDSVDEE